MTLICTNVTDKWCLIEEMFRDGICVARKTTSEKMKPIMVLLFGVASTFKTERLEPYVCTLCKKKLFESFSCPYNCCHTNPAAELR